MLATYTEMLDENNDQCDFGRNSTETLQTLRVGQSSSDKFNAWYEEQTLPSRIISPVTRRFEANAHSDVADAAPYFQ
jgi:hypothetical protein